MKNPFHKHRWTIYQGSGFGLASLYRECKCGHVETRVYEYNSKKHIWISGNFLVPERKFIWIIAASSYSAERAKSKIKDLEIYKDTVFLTLSSPEDLRRMINQIVPSYWLAEDWYENDMIASPQLRTLFMTGHF